ncbi:MAG: hypothetical protein M1817_006159 [Caeruleum heppii]|nr:MAG: hypothetical protein M1817_006159 [Caeruleum heppii]
MNTQKQVSKWQTYCEKLAIRLHQHHQRHSTPPDLHPPDHPVKVICVSDTHNTHPALPAGDILIHAGDLTCKGSFEELQAQLDWLHAQPHRYKVIIAGNHDLLLDADFVDRFPERVVERPGSSRSDLVWEDIIYLQDSSVSLSFEEGRRLNIYGSPWTPQFGNWAFQYPPIRDVWKNVIPPETDILITHGPPKYHLDLNGKGCEYLLRELWRVRPKAVVFGHIHTGYGREDVHWDGVQAGWETIMSGRRRLRSLVSMILRLVLPRMFFQSSPSQATTLVNAAALRGLDGEDLREPVVLML